MGRSRESKQVNTDLVRQQEEQRRLYESLVDKYSTQANDAYGRSSELYNESLSNYRDILGDIDEGGGGRSVYEELAGTGGYSPADVEELNRNIDDYRRYASGADISEADRIRMRGGRGESGELTYDEFSRTGGFNPEQERVFRERGTSGTSSFFDALQNKMAQLNRAQGGYSPGYEAGTRAVSRDASREVTKARNDTEAALQDMIRKNRLSGAEGASRTETALQNLLAKKFTEGMGGATDTRFRLNQNVAGNKLLGARGLEGLTKGKLDTVNAIVNLRGQTPGEVASYNNSLNQAAAGGAGAANETLRTRAGFNQGGNFLSNLSKLVGAVGGAVAPFAPDKDDDDNDDDDAKGQRVTGSEGDPRGTDPEGGGNYSDWSQGFGNFSQEPPEGRVSTDERYNLPLEFGYSIPGSYNPYGEYDERGRRKGNS